VSRGVVGRVNLPLSDTSRLTPVGIRHAIVLLVRLDGTRFQEFYCSCLGTNTHRGNPVDPRMHPRGSRGAGP